MKASCALDGWDKNKSFHKENYHLVNGFHLNDNMFSQNNLLGNESLAWLSLIWGSVFSEEMGRPVFWTHNLLVSANSYLFCQLPIRAGKLRVQNQTALALDTRAYAFRAAAGGPPCVGEAAGQKPSPPGRE